MHFSISLDTLFRSKSALDDINPPIFCHERRLPDVTHLCHLKHHVELVVLSRCRFVWPVGRDHDAIRCRFGVDELESGECTTVGEEATP